jgi:cytoskeletal protein RodZ
MIGMGFRRKAAAEEVEPKGFDDFELLLGDVMRGERATLGKSLLDVQRELKIKAAYIAAIENADPTAFDTPGFIAGYVRSYARYLGMDPEWAFETFCAESGFSTAHGMSAAASSPKNGREERKFGTQGPDIFAGSKTQFVPTSESMFSRIEPGAIGSILVLVALIGGLGFGGYSVLQEVQKVQMAPVENIPVVVADLDPLAGVGIADETLLTAETDSLASFAAPTSDVIDRLYRPQALETPVMIARDGPISALDPSSIGALAPTGGASSSDILAALAEANVTDPARESTVQVTEEPMPGVQVVAVRPAWVRVNSADGTVIFEGIMNGGDIFDVPQTEEAATLRVGESGAVYFQINGEHFGPVGERGVVTSNVALSVDSLTSAYQVADLTADVDLAKVVAELTPQQ